MNENVVTYCTFMCMVALWQPQINEYYDDDQFFFDWIEGSSIFSCSRVGSYEVPYRLSTDLKTELTYIQ